tara:strand:+ start:234 stop:593 length:360 start_codon:yes stop_codon:yes gene_type:complete
MFQLKGKLKDIKDTQKITDTFQKREFVITDDSSQYPQHIMFQLTQDRCPLLDGYQLGSEITVNFNLRGREWTSPAGDIKFFNTLEAWRIEASATAAAQAPAPANIPPAMETGSADDLPF